MNVLLDEKDLQKLIVIGDRILIKPKIPQSKTKSGLFLPPGDRLRSESRAWLPDTFC
jgi:hypothetical protein